MTDDLAAFESCRPSLLALAYRMLGDLGRAEDAVQEAWLRWQGRDAVVDNPKGYLLKVVARLCLNELDSAQARREESRSDRLPEPVDLSDGGLAEVEALDQISMAFLVVLQRLTPAERAVLLLHDVFDFSHSEIAGLVRKTEPACRQLLHRAREHVAEERRVMTPSGDEHRRLLQAFLMATAAGDVAGLTKLLADDAVMISDGGAAGVSFAGIRNLPRPLIGSAKIAAFLTATTRRDDRLVPKLCELNGQPAALLLMSDGQPLAAILLSVADGQIRRVFVQADAARLRHLGPTN